MKRKPSPLPQPPELLTNGSQNQKKNMIGKKLKYTTFTCLTKFFGDKLSFFLFFLSQVSPATVPPEIRSLLNIERSQTEGFKFEFGKAKINYPSKIDIENKELNIPFYSEYLYKKGDENSIHFILKKKVEKFNVENFMNSRKYCVLYQ